MSKKLFDNSDNDDENSFQKEYLNIFNNDFLEDDEADDDYNVVEDILTHKYNYDDKPYYLSIPKKEVNDLINDANLQDNLDIFSDEENEFRYLSRKTHRNKDKKNNNININNKQLSSLSNSLMLENKNNSNLKSINLNNKQLSNFSNISAIHQRNNEEEKLNGQNNKLKLNMNKISQNNQNVQLKEHKIKKGHKQKNNNFNNNQNIFLENNNLNVNNQNYINNTTSQNNILYQANNNNNFNNLRYDCLSQIKEINQSKGLEQMDIIEKLLFLLKQYDFMLQLLIQNLMMTDNKNLKFRCYTLLFSFYMAKQRVIENLKFPEFPVSFEFNDIFKNQNEINFLNNPYQFPNNNYQNLRLQLSFFQPPILEILPLLVKFIIKRTFTRD